MFSSNTSSTEMLSSNTSSTEILSSNISSTKMLNSNTVSSEMKQTAPVMGKNNMQVTVNSSSNSLPTGKEDKEREDKKIEDKKIEDQKKQDKEKADKRLALFFETAEKILSAGKKMSDDNKMAALRLLFGPSTYKILYNFKRNAHQLNIDKQKLEHTSNLWTGLKTTIDQYELNQKISQQNASKKKSFLKEVNIFLERRESKNFDSSLPLEIFQKHLAANIVDFCSRDIKTQRNGQSWSIKDIATEFGINDSKPDERQINALSELDRKNLLNQLAGFLKLCNYDGKLVFDLFKNHLVENLVDFMDRNERVRSYHYDIVLMSVDGEEKINEDLLKATLKNKHGKHPILIKQGNEICLYGFTEGDWKLTSLDKQVFSKIKFPLKNNEPLIVRQKAISENIYREINSKKGHVQWLYIKKIVANNFLGAAEIEVLIESEKNDLSTMLRESAKKLENEVIKSCDEFTQGNKERSPANFEQDKLFNKNLVEALSEILKKDFDTQKKAFTVVLSSFEKTWVFSQLRHRIYNLSEDSLKKLADKSTALLLLDENCNKETEKVIVSHGKIFSKEAKKIIATCVAADSTIKSDELFNTLNETKMGEGQILAEMTHPETGLTLLHIAMKMYKESHIQSEKEKLVEIIELLYEYGANPYAETCKPTQNRQYNEEKHTSSKYGKNVYQYAEMTTFDNSKVKNTISRDKTLEDWKLLKLEIEWMWACNKAQEINRIGLVEYCESGPIRLLTASGFWRFIRGLFYRQDITIHDRFKTVVELRDGIQKSKTSFSDDHMMVAYSNAMASSLRAESSTLLSFLKENFVLPYNQQQIDGFFRATDWQVSRMSMDIKNLMNLNTDLTEKHAASEKKAAEDLSAVKKEAENLALSLATSEKKAAEKLAAQKLESSLDTDMKLAAQKLETDLQLTAVKKESENLATAFAAYKKHTDEQMAIMMKLLMGKEEPMSKKESSAPSFFK